MTQRLNQCVDVGTKACSVVRIKGKTPTALAEMRASCTAAVKSACTNGYQSATTSFALGGPFGAALQAGSLKCVEFTKRGDKIKADTGLIEAIKRITQNACAVYK